LTHTKFSGASRYSAIAKSPLTGGYGEAEAGGWWGPELVAAGYNAILLEGQAEHPVYVWIHDGEVEICDASPIWGLGNKAAFDWLQEELGRARLLQIGPAGENMVRYACTINELRHANGRTGMGAVMGSKKVKAIAVRGSAKPHIANPEAFETLKKWHNDFLLESFFGKMFRESGTAAGMEYQNITGGLPTHNFQEMTFSKVDKISGKVLKDEYLKGHGTCLGCVLRCKPNAHVEGDDRVDPALGGPEYETLAALGSLCGVSDMPALLHMNAKANDLGMDTISLGGSIAFAMECFDEGLLTEADTGGLELRFGDADAMLSVIDQIAHRDGIGDLLAEGVARAAQSIGNGAEQFALTVKGQEFPMHDPRGKVSQALAYAVCPTGADHNTTAMDKNYAKKGPFLDAAKPLGLHNTLPEYSLGPEKVRFYTYMHHERSLYNSLLICMFVSEPMVPLTLTKLGEVVQAVTGWDISDWELLKVGERGTNLARLFNVAHGFTAEDDVLPPRMFKPVPSGPTADRKIDPQELQKAISTYYAMMGWDEKGVPTQAKLYELGLEEFVPNH
jgi:aldehyde:ferredoxin oxidoreductase